MFPVLILCLLQFHLLEDETKALCSFGEMKAKGRLPVLAEQSVPEGAGSALGLQLSCLSGRPKCMGKLKFILCPH